MSLSERFVRWIKSLFYTPTEEGDKKPGGQQLPPLIFARTEVLGHPPSNINVQNGTIYVVAANQHLKWAMFQCPCGCSSVITLSLQPVHQPHWIFSESDEKRATLHPSIWRDKGCFSHFWMKGGRVYWCHDTGKPPTQRRR